MVPCVLVFFSPVIAPAQVVIILFGFSFIQFRPVHKHKPLSKNLCMVKGLPAYHSVYDIRLYFLQFHRFQLFQKFIHGDSVRQIFFCTVPHEVVKIPAYCLIIEFPGHPLHAGNACNPFIIHGTQHFPDTVFNVAAVSRIFYLRKLGKQLRIKFFLDLITFLYGILLQFPGNSVTFSAHADSFATKFFFYFTLSA